MEDLLFIGANLSEERFFPETLSKDFWYYGIFGTGHMSCTKYAKHPKVLGRELEGEPFFKRVSLNNKCKFFYISINVV